jgi:hypothetical protein
VLPADRSIAKPPASTIRNCHCHARTQGRALPCDRTAQLQLKGVKVTDLSSFFEQYKSRVRIDLLRESWFIFGDGFRQVPHVCEATLILLRAACC